MEWSERVCVFPVIIHKYLLNRLGSSGIRKFSFFLTRHNSWREIKATVRGLHDYISECTLFTFKKRFKTIIMIEIINQLAWMEHGQELSAIIIISLIC